MKINPLDGKIPIAEKKSQVFFFIYKKSFSQNYKGITFLHHMSDMINNRMLLPMEKTKTAGSGRRSRAWHDF